MKAYKHLVRFALAAGHNVSVFDGEEWATDKSTDYQEIIEAIESVEEAQLVINATADIRMAWARVSAFGLADDETVVDYTVNDFMNSWEAAYERATA
jgi:hypothetical protein